MDLCSLSAYQYHLPEELIAQTPLRNRDSSRLMLIDRGQETISEISFRDLPDLLNTGDTLVFNDTKVIPARLCGKKETGGDVEIFLLEKKGEGVWDALAKPAKKLKAGYIIHFSDTFSCKIIEKFDAGIVRVRFNDHAHFDSHLEIHGKIPLPPYISRDTNLMDSHRYQTVYAANSGAVAAPTAGLHFTESLLEALSNRGVLKEFITLHVGLGTFKPVVVEDISQHPMHKECYFISERTAARLNKKDTSRRQICVGTTSLRTLEAATTDARVILAGEGSTNLFIYPGYRFKNATGLLTNFHLPGSTLLMLVSAFGGYDLMMEAYRKAVCEKFRFFSYGDAMLIL